MTNIDNLNLEKKELKKRIDKIKKDMRDLHILINDIDHQSSNCKEEEWNFKVYY